MATTRNCPLSRKQVHLLMPDDLHRQVKQKADGAGVSLTAYLLSLIEADLQSEPYARNNIYGLALRVRAIEVHLGLDSRHPGQRLDPAVKEQLSHTKTSPAADVTPAGEEVPRRRASDRAAEAGSEVPVLQRRASDRRSSDPPSSSDVEEAPRRRASDRAADAASEAPPLQRRASDRRAQDQAPDSDLDASPPRRRASDRMSP